MVGEPDTETRLSESGKDETMTIVQRMREQLRAAMKARDTVKTTFLRYWIAGLTLGSGEEMVDDAAIKKMRSVLKEAQTGQSTFTPEEVALVTRVAPRDARPRPDPRGARAVADAIRSARRMAWRWAWP